MGASRKLQGEIDRVLKKVQEGVDMFDSIWNKLYDTENPNQKEKYEGDLKKEIKKLQRYRDQIKTWQQSSEIKDKKISASYEQALMESRKLIEREMERFKICEKETKTKAFSIEGLGQQPKTDPKEKAKSDTRDWLNNVVSELENEIDSFEAEMEGLFVKKGKTRPPRLTHLETSIVRHKAHIMKLELILRLLDNDELSPEQVNDVKDFLDDYVDRNQEDFDEFSDVDELYSSLPLEKESLEDLVTVVPPSLVKGVSASAAAVTTKPSLGGTPDQTHATIPTPILASAQSAVGESVLQDKDTDTAAKTAPPKGSALVPASQTPLDTHTIPGNVSMTPGITPGATEDETNFLGRRSSPVLGETVSSPTSLVGLTDQPPSSMTSPPSSGNTFSSTGALGFVPLVSEMAKRNTSASDDQSGNTATAKAPSRLILPQASNASDGHLIDAVTLGSRVLTSPVVPGMQWMPGSSFQNRAEVGQVRGRTEIAPDVREKFLQRFQQVQQQGQTNLGITSIVGGKPYSAQQQTSLLQQFNGQSSSVSANHGLVTGVLPSGLNTPASSASSLQKPSTMHLLSNQKTMVSTPSKEAETDHSKVEEFQQQPLKEDPLSDCGPPLKIAKNLMPDGELKASYAIDTNEQSRGVSQGEPATGMRETDLTAGQPMQQANPSAGSLGVIGRRSVSDVGATMAGPGNDQLAYNLKMLEAAYHKLPQPKDSERPKNYTPRNPAITPASYPQVQAPIINKSTFWERLVADTYGNDMFFFSFYYQQGTYQQYLAAKELKRRSWRYHKKYNTWFQRHEEPRITTDDYEQGKYVYFDFHIGGEEQNGWCQRLKNDFTFEYVHLEDELNI